MQPLSQAAVGPMLRPCTDIWRDCQWRQNLPPVCPVVCACAEVRPLLCLVRATPLHVCVCVYVCVCRCVLPCLSFWCMCRSGVWLSCCLCVLVPLFSSEQCLVSWCPSRRSPFLPPLPGTLSHSRPPIPAGCSAHLMSALLSLCISDRNQSWPSCPWQARLLGPNVKEG